MVFSDGFVWKRSNPYCASSWSRLSKYLDGIVGPIVIKGKSLAIASTTCYHRRRNIRSFKNKKSQKIHGLEAEPMVENVTG